MFGVYSTAKSSVFTSALSSENLGCCGFMPDPEACVGIEGILETRLRCR